MNNNNTAETAKKSQTAKTKVPTGKVKTTKSKEEIRKLREEQYATFRINALKRRAKRMGLTEEQTNECIEKLKAQLKAPNQYYIHVLFKKGLEKMAIEAIKNAKIECKILTKDWAMIIGDQDILKKLREILPTSATIHPHAKKFESVLPRPAPIDKTPTNNTTEAKKKAKAARKMKNVSNNTNRLTKHAKRQRWKSERKTHKKGVITAKRKSSCKIVPKSKTKRSMGSEKASTDLKQAALKGGKL